MGIFAHSFLFRASRVNILEFSNKNQGILTNYRHVVSKVTLNCFDIYLIYFTIRLQTRLGGTIDDYEET